jgi:hypothetical protein
MSRWPQDRRLWQRRGLWRDSRDGRQRDDGRWTALRARARERDRRHTASRSFVLSALDRSAGRLIA